MSSLGSNPRYALENQCEPCPTIHTSTPARAPLMVAASLAQAHVAHQAPPRPSHLSQALLNYNAAVIGKESPGKARAALSGWSAAKATY